MVSDRSKEPSSHIMSSSLLPQLLIVLLLFTFSSIAEVAQEEEVPIEGAVDEPYLLDMNLENFEDTINHYEQIVVGFYAPW
jgi:hypothetical protein